eukprot:4068845-Amphidinium_carterae.1
METLENEGISIGNKTSEEYSQNVAKMPLRSSLFLTNPFQNMCGNECRCMFYLRIGNIDVKRSQTKVPEAVASCMGVVQPW